MTEFGVITQVGQKRISRGSATPTSKGGGGLSPQIFGPHTYAEMA